MDYKHHKLHSLDYIKILCLMIGVLMSSAFDALFQDFLGKEKFIEYLEVTWIDITWWFWIVPLLLLAVWYGNVGNHHETHIEN